MTRGKWREVGESGGFGFGHKFNLDFVIVLLVLLFCFN